MTKYECEAIGVVLFRAHMTKHECEAIGVVLFRAHMTKHECEAIGVVLFRAHMTKHECEAIGVALFPRTRASTSTHYERATDLAPPRSVSDHMKDDRHLLERS